MGSKPCVCVTSIFLGRGRIHLRHTPVCWPNSACRCYAAISLNETFEALKELTGYKGNVKYEAERGGDIKHSLADISLAQKHLGYKVLVNFEDGLRRTVEWYKKQGQTVGV